MTQLSSNSIAIGVGTYYGNKALFIQTVDPKDTIGIGVPELQWNHHVIPAGTIVITFSSNSDVKEMIYNHFKTFYSGVFNINC